MCHDLDRYLLEWEQVSDSSRPFIDNSNPTLNVQLMLICTREVECWRPRQIIHHFGKGCKFVICGDRDYLEPFLQIVGENRLECCKDGSSLAIGEMSHRREAYLPTQHQEEWDFIHKEYIN